MSDIKINKTKSQISSGPDFMELVNAWRFCNRTTPEGEQQFFVTFVSGPRKINVVVYELLKEDGGGDRFIVKGRNLGTDAEVSAYYDLGQNVAKRGYIEETPAVGDLIQRRRLVISS